MSRVEAPFASPTLRIARVLDEPGKPGPKAVELTSEQKRIAPYRLNGEWFIGHREILAYLEILGTDTRRFSNETIWEGHLA